MGGLDVLGDFEESCILGLLWKCVISEFFPLSAGDSFLEFFGYGDFFVGVGTRKKT